MNGASQGRFLTGSTMGHVTRMTLTGATGITFVFLVDAANLFWVSRLGDPILVAAIGYAFAIQFFSVSIGVGMMIAATAMVSRQIGEGHRDKSRRTAGASMVLTVVVQALVALLIIMFRDELVGLAGARGEAARLAARYLAFTVPSLAVMALGLVATATLRAEGDGRRAMFVTLTSGSISVIVDPFLIVWLELGLDGAALALILSRFVLAAMALRFAIGTHDLVARPDKEALRTTAKPFAAIAVPAILTQIAAPFGNYLLTSVIAGFGDAAVAAWAVINRLTVVAFGGIFSLAGAIGGIFGQNFGAGQYDRLRTTYRDALIFVVIYVGVVWAVVFSLSDMIMVAFDVPEQAQGVFRAFTTIGAGAFVLTGALFVSNAAFNTLGKPTRSSVINWVRDGVLTFPVALWFAGIWQASGVIYAQALVGAVVGVLAAAWGWVYVSGLGAKDAPSVDLATRRGYRDPNRYRRR